MDCGAGTCIKAALPFRPLGAPATGEYQRSILREFVNAPENVRLAAMARSSTALLCKGFQLTGNAIFNATAPAGFPSWEALRQKDVLSTKVGHVGGELYIEGQFAEAASYMLSHLEEAVGDCAGGVATTLINALPYFDQMFGHEIALRLFLKSSFLLHQVHLRRAGGWELSRLRGNGTRFAPNLPALPRLFGLQTRRCGVSDFLIHVQDIGRSDVAVRCSSGLLATEVWLHRMVLWSDCATTTAERANLIFLPLYSTCEHWRRNQWWAWDRKTAIRPFFEVSDSNWEILGRAVKDSSRSAGYVLALSEEKWPLLGISCSGIIRPRLLVVEARPLHCTHYDRIRAENPIFWEMRCFHCHTCFRPGYDVVVPSFIDYFTRARLLKANIPYVERPWLVVYHGGGLKLEGVYGEVLNWRFRLKRLQNFPRVSIGMHHSEYDHMLGQGRFCLIPKGVGYWTHRLYEAIFAGCIPVILSDHVVLPFQGLYGIDWRQMSVKWPEEAIGEQLYKWLEQLDDHGPDMKAAVDRSACWFDYHGNDECNAMRATLRALSSASQPSLTSFWNAPNFPDPKPGEQLQRWLEEHPSFAEHSQHWQNTSISGMEALLGATMQEWQDVEERYGHASCD